jgi:5'-nucleotidase
MTRTQITAALAPLLLAGCATNGKLATAPITIGIIGINDFHGALEPPKQSVVAPDGKGGTVQMPAGGAAWLASAIDSVRAKYSHHMTVAAGDLIGGTPLTSSLFLDEPAISVLGQMGLDFNAVGNHEFDSGVDELLRKQSGGCAQHTARKPCQVEPFKGAKFTMLAANTVKNDGTTLFPATAMRSFGTGRSAVKIGLIGMTLQGTGALSPPEVSKVVRFTNEADTANVLVEQLKAQGADAIVLLIHEGGRTSGLPDPNGCEGLNADIRPILDRLDTRVDLVVSGHTHWAYVCDYAKYNPAKPFLLTSAGLWGKTVSDITLEIDPVSRKVVSKRARNVIVQSVAYEFSGKRIENTELYPRFEPRKDVEAYVARYVTAAAEFSQRKVATIAAPIDKTEGKLGNTGGPLGNLIADAQLAATGDAKSPADSSLRGAQIAFMNPFGIRRSLNAAADGSVSFGDLYAVQPFGNELVTISLTGAQLKAVLEQGFDAEGPEQVLTPSEGFAYSYDRSRAVGDRITAMTLNGAAIDLANDYRVTVANFLANGGDSFSVFLKGRNRSQGPTDIAALEEWLQAKPGRAAPAESRTTDLRPELNPNNRVSPPGQKYR